MLTTALMVSHNDNNAFKKWESVCLYLKFRNMPFSHDDIEQQFLSKKKVGREEIRSKRQHRRRRSSSSIGNRKGMII